jgi:glycosyltransferase involved in cell wall biosynthesis
LRATSKKDDAVLVVKSTSFNEGDLMAFQRDVATMERQCGRSLADAAPVLFLRASLTEEQLRALYHSVTDYISMSFGEGWDLAMTEAAASGLRLIAPNHTGYREYLTREDATLLPVTLVPAKFEGSAGSVDHVFFDGLRWWKPDEDAAVEAITRAIAQGEPKLVPNRRIIDTFTWSAAARKLHTVLRDVMTG